MILTLYRTKKASCFYIVYEGYDEEKLRAYIRAYVQLSITIIMYVHRGKI